jgi:hypothetical protein
VRIFAGVDDKWVRKVSRGHGDLCVVDVDSPRGSSAGRERKSVGTVACFSVPVGGIPDDQISHGSVRTNDFVLARACSNENPLLRAPKPSRRPRITSP